MTVPPRLTDIELSALTDHIGPRVAHVTAKQNTLGIINNGLWPASTLAENAGVDPKALALRVDRRLVSGGAVKVLLGHQRPIAQHIRSAEDMLEGYTPKSWALEMDRRVFFWGNLAKLAGFQRHLEREGPTSILWFNTRKLLSKFHSQIDLSPLNSGSFVQGGARAKRGSWLFVPASAGLSAFRTNRQNRGLIKAQDKVTEISLRGGISATWLSEVLEEIK